MSTFLFWLVLIVMVIGALGTFLPILPGAPIIFLAALGYGYYEGFHNITVSVLVVLFILMALSLLIDYLAGVMGAKKYGATKYGAWGSFIGGVLGVVFLHLPGLIAGPFIGAVAGEVINGRPAAEALKVGVGTVMGFAGGAIIKFALAAAMIIIYIGQF